MNPTGVKTWASATAMSLPGPVPDCPRQNADFQKPFSFTKQGECVLDNGTGLMWAPAGPAMPWTDCPAYAAQARFGGFSDWRVPSIKEQMSVVDFSRVNPSTDPTYFPETGIFWSSTVDVSYADAQYVYALDFGTGGSVREQPMHPHAVRLVRGTPLPDSKFTVNGATITDTTTGLMWKRDYEMVDPAHPGDWQNRIDTFDWQTCLQRAVADTTGGYFDWRLPNIKELQSLVPYTHVNPAIDSAFPPTPFQSLFWSSTPMTDFNSNQNQSWLVAFDAGGTIPMPRNFAQYARLVRDVGTSTDGYTEAQVLSWFAAVNFCPHPAGVAYWQVKANGGQKAFYGTARDLTVTTCNRLIAELP